MLEKRYVRIELPDDCKVTGADGRKIEEVVHGTIVGSPSLNVGHFSTSPSSFSLLLEELARYADSTVGKSKFAAIERLAAIPFHEKLGSGMAGAFNEDDTELDVLLGLFPDLLSRERDSVCQGIKAMLSAAGGTFAGATEGETGVYIRVRARAADVQAVAQSFISIQSVDRTEEVVELSSRPGPQIETGVTVVPRDDAPLVCVIDTGVATGSRFIDPFVVAREQPLGPPHSEDHGTFVASRVLFGDSIRDQVAAGTLDNRTRVVSVSAFTRDSIGNKIPPTTEQLIRIVRDTVARWHTQARVFNLSLNLSKPDQAGATVGNTVSPLAAEIDALSRRYSVLFVVSAGNYPPTGSPPPADPFPDYFTREETRVLAPAEAMLAITVGSCAERENGGSMVSAGSPSPFTRRGPGLGTFRKPDILAHGGNNGAGWRDHDDLSVAGIGPQGDAIAYGCGTSYAAPVVASLAAQILDCIPNATVELVRALLVHFARYPDDARTSDVLSKVVGNGRIDPARILRSTQWQQTYAFMGHIDFRQILRIPFYVPSGLTRRKTLERLRVRCTVAFAPETNRTLRSGYCKSNLRCKLVKLDSQSREKEVTSEKCAEAMQDRYSSVVRLERTFSRHVGHGDWKLLVEQESRWRLKDSRTPVAALVTVEDPKSERGIDIRAMIRAEAQGRYATELTAKHVLRV